MSGHNNEEHRTYFDDTTVAAGVLYTIVALGIILTIYFFG